jgi:hypothetical protein
MSFGRGMLAMAGITSVMGMVGSAVDMTTEQGTSNDPQAGWEPAVGGLIA